MTAKFPVFAGAVVITTGENDTIRIAEDSGAFEFDAVLLAGTFFVFGDGTDTDDLCRIIKNALNTASTASGGSYTYTVTFTPSIDDTDITGTVSITSTGTNLNWKGDHANHDFPSDAIGIPVGAQTGPSTNVNNSLYGTSPSNTWVGYQPIIEESPRPPQRPAIQHETAGGQTYTFINGAKTKRRNESFEHIRPERVYIVDAGTSDPAQSFESFWDNVGDGRIIRIYHSPVSSGTDLVTLTDTTHLVGAFVPMNLESYPDFELDEVARLYSWDIDFREYKAA